MASAPPGSDGASQGSGNSPSTPGAPAVIIACAISDAPIIGEVAQSLSERGHQVEVVPGADTDSALLTGAVQTFQRQGLYVLCRSSAMERSAVDNLRAILRREGVPFGRTLTLAVESGSQAARTLEDRILSVARRMVTGRGDSGPVNTPAILPPPTTKVTKAPEPPAEDPGDDDLDTKVTVGGSAPFAAPGDDAPTAGPAGAVEAADVDAWADSLAGKPLSSDPEDHADTSVDQALDVQALGSGAPAAAEDQPSEALSADESTQVDHLSQDAPPGDDFAPSGVDRTQVSARKVEDVMAAEPEVAPVAPPISTAPPLGMTAAQPVVSPSPSASSMDVESFRTGPSRATLLMVGGALAAVSVLIAVIMLFRDNGEAEADDDDKVASADKDKTTPSDADSDAKGEAADPVDDTAGEADPPEDEQDGPDEGGGGEPADGGGDSAAPEPSTDAPENSTPLPSPSVEDVQVVVAAVESRKVRALDIFLVTADPTKPMTFASAEVYCKTLEVEGLSSWRLPTIGELNSLGDARMYKSGVLWSSTLGDAFGDERLVYNTKKRSIGAVAASWDGARTVCIRERS